MRSCLFYEGMNQRFYTLTQKFKIHGSTVHASLEIESVMHWNS